MLKTPKVDAQDEKWYISNSFIWELPTTTTIEQMLLNEVHIKLATEIERTNFSYLVYICIFPVRFVVRKDVSHLNLSIKNLWQQKGNELNWMAPSR